MTLPEPATLADFGPMAERAVSADAEALIRFRGSAQSVAGFVRLPYDVLAGRTIATESRSFDLTLSVADFLRWQAEPERQPVRKDASWLAALPPAAGWQRVELVPDQAIREVVRSGALLARDATSRSGQQALLGAIVLTAHSGTATVEVPLGPLSALTRMGFLPRGGQAAVDIAPGWIRIAAEYGSTYAATGSPLNLLAL